MFMLLISVSEYIFPNYDDSTTFGGQLLSKIFNSKNGLFSFLHSFIRCDFGFSMKWNEVNGLKDLVAILNEADKI